MLYGCDGDCVGCGGANSGLVGGFCCGDGGGGGGSGGCCVGTGDGIVASHFMVFGDARGKKSKCFGILRGHRFRITAFLVWPWYLVQKWLILVVVVVMEGKYNCLSELKILQNLTAILILPYRKCYITETH